VNFSLFLLALLSISRTVNLIYLSLHQPQTVATTNLGLGGDMLCLIHLHLVGKFMFYLWVIWIWSNVRSRYVLCVVLMKTLAEFFPFAALITQASDPKYSKPPSPQFCRLTTLNIVFESAWSFIRNRCR
jgi:hypothetical protein